MRIKIIFLVIVSIQHCLVAQSKTDSVFVEGLIVDADTDEPLAGAFVIAGTGSSATRHDGRFAFMSLRVDTMRVRVSYISYGNTQLSVLVRSNQQNVFLYLPIHCVDFSFSEAYRRIPRQWYKIDAGNKFSFLLPPDLKKRERYHGVDTYVELYESNRILISFDYGAHTTLAPDPQDVNMRMTVIGCKPARLSWFTDPTRYTGFKNVVAADFDFPFTFWGEYNSKEDRDTVLTILHSLKFPDNK